MTVTCHTQATARVAAIVDQAIGASLGHLSPRRILIKPNWVMHEMEPQYPIAAMVTDPRVIEATVRACVSRFPGAELITVGDCLEQRADWPLMCNQSGLTPVMERLAREWPGRVVFRDLRREVYKDEGGTLVLDPQAPHGDPAGYREIQLLGQSHLEAIADQAEQFSVHDHNAALTRSSHRSGDHRYLVCQTVLDADLVINLPKWKAHSKSGLTGALKNLVGINGDKSYLPHFRRGSPRWGGDEYSDESRWLYWLQNTLYEKVRGTPAYRLMRPAWRLAKHLNTARRRRQSGQSAPADFYVVGGSWHGNQTVWRMIYDLNLAIQRVDAEGVLQPALQRHYFSIVDGLTSGEGDGPLKARPRATDMLVCGDDPFAIDATLGWMMGFDPDRIPILSERRQFLGHAWGAFDWRELPVAVDGRSTRLCDVAINFKFAPPPGWLGHIERPEAGSS